GGGGGRGGGGGGGGAGGGRAGAGGVGGEQPAEGGAGAEALLGRGGARQHPRAVVGADLRAQEGRARGVEHVEGDVVGVGPDAELGIVVEAGVGERVPRVGAGRVRRLGDGNALEEWRRRPVGPRHRELRDDPA